MSQPSYKLTYFDARGLAEPIRLLLAYVKIPFEDVRTKEWASLKPKTPFRQIPILEFDGKQFGQSHAITRYLAKKHKLAGTNDEEQLLVDGVADYVKDIFAARLKWWFEKDPETKKKLQEEYFKTNLVAQAEILQALLKEGGGQFFVPSGVTFADFVVANEFFSLKKHYPTALEPFPELKAHLERVHNLPGIKEWVAQRPDTDN
ncbi:putative Glutathione S-transferase 4 [Hypsibius exemplaris]|uniref:glutathione transferase n=1 Tax=Hypsibius exemplaris TaxID=2072580 RepID=A0A1W0X5M1_HYPEX|nr:putative Glutathione S-transferase 4 [Hypsibius exemplaris]